ncbi:Gfo/Idh/MocA family protein [Bacteroidota bacterium]
MKNIRVGVVGTGHLGRLHAKFFKEIHNCELIGIYDINEDTAYSVGKEYSLQVFKSLDELLPNVDVLSVASTTSSHYKIAKKAIKLQKNLFIEKPITSNIKQAEEIVELSKKKNVMIQIGHIERFNSALISLEKYDLDPKFIQTDRLAQFNPRGLDVAVVHDLMIHDIDIILSLVKSSVKDVHASGISVVSEKIDIANARLEFENGAVANVTASRISQKKMRKMRMFQKDAYITLDFLSGVSEVFRLVSPEDKSMEHFISFGEMGIGENKKAVIYEQPERVEINALKYELQLFINSILNNEPPKVSGEDGLKALKVAEKIVNKIEESKIN